MLLSYRLNVGTGRSLRLSPRYFLSGKKKKEIAEQIAQLEQELEEKHVRELAALEKPDGAQDNSANANNESNNLEVIGPTICDNEATEEVSPEIPKVSRAQKRRNKKAAEDKERDKRIMEQEELNKQGPRLMELNTIKENLKQMGLQIYNVPADGNCLYCAINHQLEVTGREKSDVTSLRKITANYIREHKEEFIPFMYSDDDGPVNEKHFEDYCKSVANTKLWGGQLELRALSNILKCPIKIIQATGQPTVQGENFQGPPLVLTYHRHLYRLGEHYNSTVTIEDELRDS